MGWIKRDRIFKKKKKIIYENILEKIVNKPVGINIEVIDCEDGATFED